MPWVGMFLLNVSLFYVLRSKIGQIFSCLIPLALTMKERLSWFIPYMCVCLFHNGSSRCVELIRMDNCTCVHYNFISTLHHGQSHGASCFVTIMDITYTSGFDWNLSLILDAVVLWSATMVLFQLQNLLNLNSE